MPVIKVYSRRKKKYKSKDDLMGSNDSLEQFNLLFEPLLDPLGGNKEWEVIRIQEAGNKQREQFSSFVSNSKDSVTAASSSAPGRSY
ncbi:hypothetical protein E3N88_17610 [Mikania micrantha]|uniref:Uncharacterized protein n=1 Tax=Mikania micrantha TaxID=192012 RepID=A0A5N6NSX0_9ASTR|nr:hypothetical protein E3N88_17610 [Mikania micrantha]